MSGAMLQLASLGSQDVYFTNNPERTLFKKMYKRYTNFSTETVQLAFDSGNLEFGGTSTVVVDKLGDLIYKLILVIKLDKNTTKNWGYVEDLGHAIIDNINITIGQEEIDIHYQDWIHIYNQLYRNPSHDNKYNEMIGNVSKLKTIDNDKDEYTLYIPLHFWHTKNSNLTFPICSTNSNLFQVKVTLRNASDIINYKYNADIDTSDYPLILSSYILVDYIFLDTQERTLFINNDHEYLIETMDDMTDSINSSNPKINLIFDKPSKYLIWCVQLERYYERNNYLSWAFDGDWEKAKDNFAKLIWLATRQGLSVEDTSNPTITFSGTFINIGESPGLISGGNTLLESLVSKVDALLLFAETIDSNIVGKANIDNVVLTKNNITFEDMSYTLEELKGYNGTTTQDTFLDINSYSVVDIFNYGNYVNRSDNPIITSQLVLNGREKFQERDGNYFNNLTCYRYFANAPDDGINVYPFSLKPMNTEPTGTLNLNYIENKDLTLKLGKNGITSTSYFNDFFKNGRIRIFSYNYSLLKVSYNKDVASLLY